MIEPDDLVLNTAADCISPRMRRWVLNLFKHCIRTFRDFAA